jgi:hypothetical protein
MFTYNQSASEAPDLSYRSLKVQMIPDSIPSGGHNVIWYNVRIYGVLSNQVSGRQYCHGTRSGPRDDAGYVEDMRLKLGSSSHETW